MPSGLLAAIAAGSAQTVLPAAPRFGHYAAATPSIFGMLAALGLVIALILGLAWLLKRMPGSGFRQNDQLRLVAVTPLGAKQRLVVVEVAGQQLLLGVSPGGITCLHILSAPLPAAAPAQLQLPNFAQLLARRLRKGN